MQRLNSLLFVVIAAHLFTGCAALPPVPPPDSAVQQCLVCRYHRDWACLEVSKGADTPQLNVGGRTYYFCSTQCRAVFAKKPEIYTAK